MAQLIVFKRTTVPPGRLQSCLRLWSACARWLRREADVFFPAHDVGVPEAPKEPEFTRFEVDPLHEVVVSLGPDAVDHDSAAHVAS